MIVKNEAHVIADSLASVKPFIDTWIIVDTGSTDDTKAIIRKVLKDIPGTLYDRPWVNFAHNRNEAILLAKNKADYLLFMDADDLIVAIENFQWPKLEKDFYSITSTGVDVSCCKIFLVNNKLDWRWKGVLHEYLVCGTADKIVDLSFEPLNGIKIHLNALPGSARSLNPETHINDIKTLQTVLESEPNNRRYQFYLARTYLELKEYELALKAFKKRAAMGGINDEELFWSLLHIALLQEKLDRPPDTIVEGYFAAYEYRPTRAEPLYYLATYYLRHQENAEAYKMAFRGLSLPPTNDQMDIIQSIYDYKLLLKFAECAFALKRVSEARSALEFMLNFPDLPAKIRKTTRNILTLVTIAGNKST